MKNCITKTVCNFYVNYSSDLFLCSTSDIHNKVHCDQNKRFMLKYYIPGVDSGVGVKRCNNKYLSGKRFK